MAREWQGPDPYDSFHAKEVVALSKAGRVAEVPHLAEAAKLLVVIQAVTDHENVGNLETNVVGLDGNGAASGLIE